MTVRLAEKADVAVRGAAARSLNAARVLASSDAGIAVMRLPVRWSRSWLDCGADRDRGRFNADDGLTLTHGGPPTKHLPLLSASCKLSGAGLIGPGSAGGGLHSRQPGDRMRYPLWTVARSHIAER